jgi:uncharacterized phage protein gp47/JayE
VNIEYLQGLKEQIGSDVKKYTYPYLLKHALSLVASDVDKREGAIIFDAIAPAAQELANLYEQLLLAYQRTYALTAPGLYLDYRAAERGLLRRKATQAVRLGTFQTESGEYIEIPVGARFSTISETYTVNYVVISQYRDLSDNLVTGYYRLQCEESGTIGNQYYGEILPINYIMGLSTAVMTDVLVPAQNDEDDETFRRRYFSDLGDYPFVGNRAHYKQWLMGINGVGGCQIYPVWQGGGTVLLSVVDSEFKPISDDFIQDIQVCFDPENAGGETGTGLGIAPIGHKVTVMTPQEIEIAVYAEVILKPSVSLPVAQLAVATALQAHISEVNAAWDVSDQYGNYYSSIFLSAVNSVIQTSGAVVSVRKLLINGFESDLALSQNSSLQQIPI